MQSLGILSYFPRDTEKVKIHRIKEEVIDKTRPWWYFDGATNGEPKRSGVGGLIFIYDYHWFSFKYVLGLDSNIFAELSALRLLLWLAKEKG